MYTNDEAFGQCVRVTAHVLARLPVNSTGVSVTLATP
jgi:hypothetical protein